MPSSTRWHTMATMNIAAPRYRMPLFPIFPTARSEMSGPASAPALPPAAMNPNSRFDCPESKISSRKLQNIESRNRFITLMNT